MNDPSKSSTGNNHDRNHPGVVRVEATAPIKSSPLSTGGIALAIGTFLALHTPSWLVLVFCFETDEHKDHHDSLPIRLLSRWLLDFTPWLANALLSFFLGVLCLCLGAAFLSRTER